MTFPVAKGGFKAALKMVEAFDMEIGAQGVASDARAFVEDGAVQEARA